MFSALGKFREKAQRKINTVFYNAVANTPFQFYLNRSYWRYKLLNDSKIKDKDFFEEYYIAQKPNYGAGIGHQLANWNSGYHHAQSFKTGFAHFPFSSNKWEEFLGFGQNEVKANDLIKRSDIKKVQLPLFDDTNPAHLAVIGNILKSYNNKRTLFLLAQDQGYDRQYETYKDLCRKFWSAPAREKDQSMFDDTCFNIALHIRRGDIVAMKKGGVSNWKDRWLDNSYYVTVLTKVLALINTDKPVVVYLFSQGTKSDFPEFDNFKNIIYCLETNVFDSFFHMAKADMLISSKSSFSYKPSLISKGIKVCPGNFWHGYPDDRSFILTNNDGEFDENKLLENLVSV